MADDKKKILDDNDENSGSQEVAGFVDGKDEQERIEMEKAIFQGGEGDKWAKEREFFRVVFPMAEVPILVIDDRRYEVVDASERGIRLRVPDDDSPFKDDQEIRGEFTFKTGETCYVEGKVLRVVPSAVVLFLADGIPFKLLMNEQRRFISIYKHLYSKD